MRYPATRRTAAELAECPPTCSAINLIVVVNKRNNNRDHDSSSCANRGPHLHETKLGVLVTKRAIEGRLRSNCDQGQLLATVADILDLSTQMIAGL